MIQTGVGVAELRLKVVVVADKGTKLLAYLSALGTGGSFRKIGGVLRLLRLVQVAIGSDKLGNALCNGRPFQQDNAVIRVALKALPDGDALAVMAFP